MKFLIILSVILGISYAQFHQGPRRQNFQQNNNQNQDQYQNVDQNQQQQQQQNDDQQQYKAQPAPVNNNYQAQNYHQDRRESTTFIPIIRFDKEQGNDGSYKAAWETGNNIIAQEEGFLKSLGPNPDVEGEELNAQVQQGSYTYTSPDGQVITVHYTADEKGFHPTGDHLPTPPPVSPEVQKGLDLIYAGIRAQQEAADRDPQLRAQQQQEYTGQYNQNHHQKYNNQNTNQNQYNTQQNQNNNNNNQYRQ